MGGCGCRACDRAREVGSSKQTTTTLRRLLVRIWPNPMLHHLKQKQSPRDSSNHVHQDQQIDQCEDGDDQYGGCRRSRIRGSIHPLVSSPTTAHTHIDSQRIGGALCADRYGSSTTENKRARSSLEQHCAQAHCAS